MLDSYFPKHKYHGIQLDRNIQPIAECKVREHVGPDAKPCKAIEVEILTAEHLWWTFQKEAEDQIKENDKIIEDPILRNRRINSAYARLWLADNRFQWAGLAAFASKQVGCGLLHAANTIQKSQRELGSIQKAFAMVSTPGAGVAGMMPSAVASGSGLMYKRLGFGNTMLFLDIYPLHRFYMERGWKEFDLCLAKRQDIWQRVKEWRVDREVLPFGKPFQEIRDGFRHIEVGNNAKSVESLAKHEQVNVLQKIMYNDLALQAALNANQFNWATNFPTGDYAEIQLTLSAECKAKPELTASFSRTWNAKLYVVEQRMEFVNRAAGQFHQLLHGPQRPLVEESIRTIYAGGGVT